MTDLNTNMWPQHFVCVLSVNGSTLPSVVNWASGIFKIFLLCVLNCDGKERMMKLTCLSTFKSVQGYKNQFNIGI